jgi:DNA (cytosine-5)-methyltransferase 1
MNYYNEHDPKAAAWLRELIAAGMIPAGVVDERSITEISPNDLSDFTQCHFFAGIGGWSLALQLAGWPEDRPVWTGSCPCQPFSHAGKQLGRKDPRHLWPAFRRLINRGNPPVVFGEQVASADGRKWLAGVFSNLEAMGYAAAGADLCAAGVGAPHIRQRLYWVANATGERRDWRKLDGNETGRRLAANCCTARGLADTAGMSGAQQLDEPRSGSRWGPSTADATECAGPCGVGNSDSPGLSEQRGPLTVPQELSAAELRGHSWDTFELLPCTDGKARRVESGTFPLADGVPGRVGLLRGYGNAIVPQTAAQFIAAWCSLNEWNDPVEGPPGSGTPPTQTTI